MYSKIKIIISILFPSVLLGLALSLLLLSFSPPAAGPFISQNVKVFSPLHGEAVTSPFKIRGEARGTWYFEASFPIRIFDGFGNELGVIPATAKSDWMTTGFVPFEATLEFGKPATRSGRIVFQKDNPSGLPEYDDEVAFPIIFTEYGKPETIKIKVYFNNSKLDPEVSCDKVFPAEREIPKTQSVGWVALQELLAGPSESEKAQGFFTSINPGVAIQKLTIVNGEAHVDFNDALESGVGGSCRVAAIRAEIIETLKQFPTVKKVIISINNRTEDILQP